MTRICKQSLPRARRHRPAVEAAAAMASLSPTTILGRRRRRRRRRRENDDDAAPPSEDDGGTDDAPSRRVRCVPPPRCDAKYDGTHQNYVPTSDSSSKSRSYFACRRPETKWYGSIESGWPKDDDYIFGDNYDDSDDSELEPGSTNPPNMETFSSSKKFCTILAASSFLLLLLLSVTVAAATSFGLDVFIVTKKVWWQGLSRVSSDIDNDHGYYYEEEDEDDGNNTRPRDYPPFSRYYYYYHDPVILSKLLHASDVLEITEQGDNDNDNDNDNEGTLPRTQPKPITFAELSRLLVPSWYDETIARLPVFSPGVMPDEVYEARKVMLKTRDLIDVFGPVYPNATRMTKANITKTMITNTTTADDGMIGDMWQSIRRRIMRGYERVGNFQDLYNCRIKYTLEMLEGRRDEVLEWRREFEEFESTYDVEGFLSSSSSLSSLAIEDGGGAISSYRHRRESHLFWKYSPRLPRGSDTATSALRLIGVTQLHNSLSYLHEARLYESIRDGRAHVPFHNLRKELRSLTDEYELFGFVMFSNKVREETELAVLVLKSARKLLGGINDDWVAFDLYVLNDIYYDERVRLSLRIDEGWADFKTWANGVANLEGTITFLARSLGAPESFGNEEEEEKEKEKGPIRQEASVSLIEFLMKRRVEPTRNLVVGNEAGDADTIVSSIALAYVESVCEEEGDGTMPPKTPVVSITRADLESRRPDVRLLLDLAGIGHAKEELIYVDDPLIAKGEFENGNVNVTLVDHNVLDGSFRANEGNWTVVEIVDHHKDMGLYLDTCSGSARTVAFDAVENRACVASTCTLVVERLEHVWKLPPYPAPLGTLLLGVILLDSGNLSPEVGKATQRDKNAVKALLENTAWIGLPFKSQEVMGINASSPDHFPDTTVIFSLLRSAKYDPEFWNGISVRSALRYDYKEYFCVGGRDKFGISAVFMSLEDFIRKENLVEEIKRYMTDMGLSGFMGILFAYYDADGHLHRQLSLCGTSSFQLDELVAFVNQTAYGLNIEEIDSSLSETKGFFGTLSARFFVQHNLKLSRKQIAPLILRFFDDTVGSVRIMQQK